MLNDMRRLVLVLASMAELVRGQTYVLPNPIHRYVLVPPIERPAPSTTSSDSSILSTPNPNAPIYASDFSSAGYFQPETNPNYIRNATCTWYTGCSSQNACGLQPVSGYTAALSQFSFGADSGFGGACGRCFRLHGYQDPYNPFSDVSTPTIVVKITDECPVQGNVICNQSPSKMLNSYGAIANFDLCEDSGAKDAFFTDANTLGMCLCAWQEVPCSEWSGSSTNTEWWNGCLASSASLWPSTSGSCANNGSPPD